MFHRCTGSIIRQVEDVLRVIDSINPRLKVKGRTGFVRKFPRRALEEGVLNAAIHFDISRVTDITVELYNDRLVVISPGGMIEPENWGESTTTSPRNRMLAELYREMGRVNLHFCRRQDDQGLIPPYGTDPSDEEDPGVLPGVLPLGGPEREGP